MRWCDTGLVSISSPNSPGVSRIQWRVKRQYLPALMKQNKVVVGRIIWHSASSLLSTSVSRSHSKLKFWLPPHPWNKAMWISLFPPAMWSIGAQVGAALNPHLEAMSWQVCVPLALASISRAKQGADLSCQSSVEVNNTFLPFGYSEAKWETEHTTQYNSHATHQQRITCKKKVQMRSSLIILKMFWIEFKNHLLYQAPENHKIWIRKCNYRCLHWDKSEVGNIWKGF